MMQFDCRSIAAPPYSISYFHPLADLAGSIGHIGEFGLICRIHDTNP